MQDSGSDENGEEPAESSSGKNNEPKQKETD